MSHRTIPPQQELILEAGRAEKQYWQDLWRYRELFYFLAWRDILVRYKQTAIGMAWAVLRPFMTMVIFSAIFGGLAKLPTQNGAPYPILVYSALLPWQFFANSLGQCSNSLIGNSGLLSKVYFPRLVVPASTIVVNFVDFLVAGMVMLGLMIYYNFIPSWRIITLPVFIAIAAAAAFGLGLWFASLNVRYRDVGHLIPYVIQFGMFVSPVAFSSNVIPEQWKFVYALNPMVTVIDGFRWAILGGEIQLNVIPASLSLIFVLVALVTGIYRFRKVERTFVDIV